MAGELEQDRKLRVFAFDPHVGRQFRSSRVREITVTIPHGMESAVGPDGEPGLRIGPVGQYLEVVDYDPASGLLYFPVDLDVHVATQGLRPSEANPQFHQQMVYAVAMRTIAAFEEALGRVALWSPRITRAEDGVFSGETYVPRLRVYPHAMREANAYYSPAKKALLFGYFEADAGRAGIAPGSMVFTCLSHDVVAHETTHALLDGMHSRFAEASNPDVLALHEAFADIVAIFQHFSHPEVLADQIAKTRGDLETESLLGQLAQEFGLALGRGGALRDALGSRGEDGVWRRTRPDPGRLRRAGTPHARGAVLVAAVFGAFVEIYRSRTDDLFRIATNGTGVMPPGAIHPDLVGRLAAEAAKAAEHVQRMCIRALDYCPPVDVRFGDYLRAIVTADHDLFPEDDYGYRTALIESFVAWGIVPAGLRIVSEETLLWPSLDNLIRDANAGAEGDETLSEGLGILIENPSALVHWIKKANLPDKFERDLHTFASQIGASLEGIEARKSSRRTSSSAAAESASSKSRFETEQLLSRNLLQLGLEADREVEWRAQKLYAYIFWIFFTAVDRSDLLRIIGLDTGRGLPSTVNRSPTLGNVPALSVQAVRMASRRGNREQIEREYVVEIVQGRRGYLDDAKQTEMDHAALPLPKGRGDFTFRRGCTLLIDARTFRIRRVISTDGTIADDAELRKVRDHLADRRATPGNALDGGRFGDPLLDDDFARLHRMAG